VYPEIEGRAPQEMTTLVGRTETGMILGTLGYLSPEQAAGKRVDFRSDQFALGALLYELATGERPFRRETTPEILTAILREEPEPIREGRPDLPPQLGWIAERCLAKDPNDRYGSTKDLARDLADLRDHLSELGRAEKALGTAKGAKAPHRRLDLVGWSTAAVFGLLAGWAWLGPRAPAPPPPTLRFTIEMPEGLVLPLDSFLPAFALSPSGEAIAFTASAPDWSRWSLYLRRFDSETAREIPGTADARSPFFSPDGTSVGFFQDGKLRKVRLGDGAIATVCSAPNPRGGAWLADDTIVFAPAGGDAALQRVPAQGGEPRPFTALDTTAGEINHRWPRAVPGGTAVLFTILTDESPGEAPGIGIARAEPGPHRVLTARGFSPGAAADRLLFVRQGALWAAPFDLRQLELRGDATRVADEIATRFFSSRAEFDIARSGELAFVGAPLTRTPRRLVWVDRQGRRSSIDLPPQDIISPRLSPDGLRVALQISEPSGFGGIWIYELERRLLSRVTPDGLHQSARWSPDGTDLFYARAGSRRTSAIYRISSRGGGQPELVLGGDQQVFPNSIAADSRRLIVSRWSEETRGDLLLYSFDDRSLVPLADSAAGETGGEVSPDGRWLAYFSDETGRHDLYLRPLESPSPRWQLTSQEPAGEIAWRRDGRELFYRSGKTLYSIAIGPGADPAPGAPRRLFEGPFDGGGPPEANYDVSADGERFLMIESDTAPRRTPISIVLQDPTLLGRSADPGRSPE
ncbi:MAG TPA: protein kinase, partial [Thermoanaerobaculia bacterium]|nr:protein kinase [Thermoanaerobaculia bacterium]